MIYWYKKCFSPKNNSQKLYSPWCLLWVLDYLTKVEIFPHRQEQVFGPNYAPGHILHEILEVKIQIFICIQRNPSKDKFEHFASLLLLQSKGSEFNRKILPLPCLDKCTVLPLLLTISHILLWHLQHGASQSIPWGLSPSCSYNPVPPPPVLYLNHITSVGNSHLIALYLMWCPWIIIISHLFVGY